MAEQIKFAIIEIPKGSIYYIKGRNIFNGVTHDEAEEKFLKQFPSFRTAGFLGRDFAPERKFSVETNEKEIVIVDSFTAMQVARNSNQLKSRSELSFRVMILKAFHYNRLFDEILKLN